jgi:hypothetical protein
MSRENISWLREDLKKNSLPTLIFTHYGLAENPEISDGCMFMKNRAEIKEIIKNDKSILAVFSGHQHVPSVIDEDGVRYYVLGSMIADESMTDTPLGEYLEIDLEDGEIKVTERRIKKDELRIDGNGGTV